MLATLADLDIEDMDEGLASYADENWFYIASAELFAGSNDDWL
jgi:hypothetical protein